MYHEQEGVRSGTDVLSNINPAWYWRKPGGGPLYDMTVYGLHTLTGVSRPRPAGDGDVRASESKSASFRGKMYPSDADDNTLMVLDFGGATFAFVYGTFAGTLTAFGQPSFYGTKGSITGLDFNGKKIEVPDAGMHFFGPHVVGKHAEMEEAHVFEDIMQLVDLAREGIPTPATAEHARHVVEIIEAAYRAGETGHTQTLTTTFTPVEGA